MGLKKIGRKFNVGGMKKIGKKSLGTIGRIGKKGGRAVEVVGNVASVVGVATGQPELVAAGVGLSEVGKGSQKLGQVSRDFSKGRIEKGIKHGLNK